VSSDLADAARLTLWFSAWADGHATLDDARDAIAGGDAAHDVLGLPDRPEPVPLILALGLLRTEGATRATLALPVAGDPLGLAGPSAFTAEATDVGEAVLLVGSGLGLVPHRVGAGVQWQAHPAEDLAQVPDPTEADQLLRRTLLESGEQLADLDVARWRPEVADALMELRRGGDLTVPPVMVARNVRLVTLATRCRAVVDLALEDDGAAVTAGEADARRRALLPLDQAARRALVAACSYPWSR
jgi:hypothetical protein